MPRFRRQLRNALGRRWTEWSHIRDLEGYSGRRVTEELLLAAREGGGLIRPNAIRLLMRCRGEMTDAEHAEWVSLVIEDGHEGLKSALLETDAMLREPRLTPEEREQLG